MWCGPISAGRTPEPSTPLRMETADSGVQCEQRGADDERHGQNNGKEDDVSRLGDIGDHDVERRHVASSLEGLGPER